MNSLYNPVQLQNPNNAAAAFQQSYNQARQQKQQEAQQTAFSNYATDQSQENLNALAPHNPQYVIQQKQAQQQHQAQQQQQEYERDIRVRAAQGEPEAIAAMAGFDWNAFQGMGAQDRAKTKEVNEYLGQASLAISQLPEAQRSQAWDQYVQQGVQLGYQSLAQHQGKYSPQGLNSIIAQSGQVKQLLDLSAPKYQSIPEGGTLVNTRDPQAVNQFQQESSAPDVGAVDGGYRFRGGDPSNKDNWEQVGGTSSNASGSFQGP